MNGDDNKLDSCNFDRCAKSDGEFAVVINGSNNIFKLCNFDECGAIPTRSVSTTGGGAIKVTYGSGLSFEKCRFYKCEGTKGAGIYIERAIDLKMYICGFLKCTSNNAPAAVYAYNCTNSTFEKCGFQSSKVKSEMLAADKYDIVVANGANLTVTGCLTNTDVNKSCSFPNASLNGGMSYSDDPLVDIGLDISSTVLLVILIVVAVVVVVGGGITVAIICCCCCGANKKRRRNVNNYNNGYNYNNGNNPLLTTSQAAPGYGYPPAYPPSTAAPAYPPTSASYAYPAQTPQAAAYPSSSPYPPTYAPPTYAPSKY